MELGLHWNQISGEKMMEYLAKGMVVLEPSAVCSLSRQGAGKCLSEDGDAVGLGYQLNQVPRERDNRGSG